MAMAQGLDRAHYFSMLIITLKWRTALHILQQGEGCRISPAALLLQQHVRTSIGSGIHSSSCLYCTEKKTGTPADCKPAHDAPRAALGMSFSGLS